MPMTIYKLMGNTAASADSVANFDVQLDGDITAVMMSGQALGMNGLDEGFAAELSFLGANTFAATDIRGSLMTIQVASGFLTSGMMDTTENMNVSGLEVPVNAGERIHLHIQLQGVPSSVTVYAYIYVRDKGSSRTPGRRR